jgi:hypothetical protein
MSFLRPLESFIGMFHCLLGMLMSGLVIFFPVMHGGGTVRVGGELVEFSSSLVRVIWHCYSNPWQPLYLRTSPFSKLFNAVHPRRGHPLSDQMKRAVAWKWKRLPSPGRQRFVGWGRCTQID